MPRPIDNAADSLASLKVHAELHTLAQTIEARLHEIAGQANADAKRKLIALLQASDKRKASQRLTARARAFAAQGGHCASCREEFTRARRPAPLQSDDAPLTCTRCARDALLANATLET